MNPKAKTWYLIAYDIREPKRLARLHYYLRKRALPLQNSVFIFKANGKYLQKLSKEIKSISKRQEDDIRIYPIHHPDALWAAGKQVSAMSGLYTGGKRKPEPASPLERFLKFFGNDKT